MCGPTGTMRAASSIAISPAGRRARDAAIAAIAPILSDTISEIGAERVRQALPVIREMRLRLEEDGGAERQAGLVEAVT
jgi:hypothetical protein